MYFDEDPKARRIRVVQITTGKEIATFPIEAGWNVGAIRAARSGGKFAWVESDETHFRVVSVDNSGRKKTAEVTVPLIAPKFQVMGVIALSPDGSTAPTVAREKHIRLLIRRKPMDF